MKKFTVMILGVSMLFICLGGVAKQLETTFRFNERLMASLFCEKEKTDVQPRRINIRQAGEEHLLLKETRERVSEDELRIRIPAPPPPPPGVEFQVKEFEFPCDLNEKPLEATVEIPRVPAPDAIERKVIIIRRPSKDKTKE